MSQPGPTQLLVFAFEADGGRFEGQVAGALERAESGGALRVLRAMYVGRDPATGELSALDLHGGTGGVLSSLLSFRLDPDRRRAASARALEDDQSGVPSAILQDVGSGLAPGAAIVAVLVEHVWAGALTDAVARAGGRGLADHFVSTRDAAEFGREVLAVLRREGPLGAQSQPGGR